MSIREQLRKIAEKSLFKQEFNTDVKAFAESVLRDWVGRVAMAANHGKYEIPLVAFTSGAEFNNVKIHTFFEQRLIDFIKEQIGDLSVSLERYLVNKKKSDITRVDSDILNEIYNDDEYKYIYVIKLSWS